MFILSHSKIAKMTVAELNASILDWEKCIPPQCDITDNKFKADRAYGYSQNILVAKAELFCRELHPDKDNNYFISMLDRELYGFSPALKMAVAMYNAGFKPMLTIENGQMILLNPNERIKYDKI